MPRKALADLATGSVPARSATVVAEAVTSRARGLDLYLSRIGGSRYAARHLQDITHVWDRAIRAKSNECAMLLPDSPTEPIAALQTTCRICRYAGQFIYELGASLILGSQRSQT